MVSVPVDSPRLVSFIAWHRSSIKRTDSRRQGANGRLIIILYQPGSPIDSEIERDLADNGIVTSAAAELYDGSDNDSADEDMNILHDEFAQILNIDDEVNLPHPRSGGEDLWGYSHVGKSDPRVKNLGNSWVVAYNSVTSLLPVNRAATSLSVFYEHVVEIAAEKLGNATAPVAKAEFVWNDLSLSLYSSAPIPWDWIIRFARAMSLSLGLDWAVLYDARATNAYWDVAIIGASLRIKSIKSV